MMVLIFENGTGFTTMSRMNEIFPLKDLASIAQLYACTAVKMAEYRKNQSILIYNESQAINIFTIPSGEGGSILAYISVSRVEMIGFWIPAIF